jgi:hypothetical protein
MRHSAESIFVVEKVREYESTFEKALFRESGDPFVLFAGKNGRPKIPWYSPFNFLCWFIVDHVASRYVDFQFRGTYWVNQLFFEQQNVSRDF